MNLKAALSREPFYLLMCALASTSLVLFAAWAGAFVVISVEGPYPTDFDMMGAALVVVFFVFYGTVVLVRFGKWSVRMVRSRRFRRDEAASARNS